MSNADWSWKPDPETRVSKAFKENRGSKPKKSRRSKRRELAKKKRQEAEKEFTGDNFYTSKEWRRLRYRVLCKYQAKCMCCGRSPKIHGVALHVDHIVPKSKNPKLQLVFENMQILCQDCNLGKGNLDATDWRPTEDEELEIVREAKKHLGDWGD